ncbi:MAG: hypothetical protein AAF447_24590 [Myxococcota bacterium]
MLLRLLTLGSLALAFACGGDDDPAMDQGTGTTDAGLDAATDDAGAGPDAGDDRDAGAEEDAFVEEDLGPQPRVIIGLGLTEFEATEDEAPAELVAGPQGGFHVDYGFRFENLDPEGLRVVLRGFDADTGEELTESVDRTLTARRVLDRGDHLIRLGDRLVFLSRCTPNLIGRRLRAEAVVAEANGGAMASDSLIVEVVDLVDPTPPEPGDCPGE